MMTIGRLSEATGVKVPTIRYYEQIGLLPDADRSTGNQRVYNRAAEERLRFVRHARDLGFPIEDIRELLNLSDQPGNSCSAVDAIAQKQLSRVRIRISRLRALKSELERMISQCAHGNIAECRVIEVLGNHALCKQDHISPG